METTDLKKSIDEIIAAIHSLDLAPIKFKLMDSREGYGWPREYADRVEIEYKRFLILLVKYPDASIVPSKEVDQFWHAHILDTLKYSEDCDKVFGYFLHHFPYFGMRGADDSANLAAAAETMERLYRLEFNESPPALPGSYCGATRVVAYCGAARSPDASQAAQPSAYCGAATDVSYCGATEAGAARSGSEPAKVLNTGSRPTLPRH